MDAALIVTIISTVAKTLRTKLQAELPGNQVPSESLLKRAIQVLMASNAIDLNFLENSDIVKMLLENIVTAGSSNPNGELTKDALKELLKTCLGTINAEGTPTKPNRKSVKVKKTGKIKYKYFILKPLPKIKGGITDSQFQLLVDAAWHRWSDEIERLTVIEAPKKSQANMLIGFTQLDNVGNKLAEATLGKPGVKEFRLQIDVAETWKPSKLLGTLIHEIGHTLGMEHSNVPGSIMYFQASKLPTDPKKVQLTQADKDAVPAFWR